MKILKTKIIYILNIVNSVVGILAAFNLLPFLLVFLCFPIAISFLIYGYIKKEGMFEYRSYVNENKIPKDYIKISETQFVKKQ